MARIDYKTLVAEAKLICQIMGVPEGTYKINCAYGGYRLVRTESWRDFFNSGFTTPKDLFARMTAIEAYLCEMEYCKRDKEEGVL